MAPDVIDLPAAAEQGRTLVRLDGVLRGSLSLTWLATAALAPEAPLATALGGGATAALLAALAVLTLLDAWPRPVAGAGLVVSLLAAPSGAALAPWLTVCGCALARLLLHAGEAAETLRSVREARRRQGRALLASELHRAGARDLEGDARSAELARAGDAFEEAGRARAELKALGVEGGSAGVRLAGRGAALLPGSLRGRVVRRLER